MLPKPVKQKSKPVLEESPKKDEIIALLDLVQEKPWHAAGAVLFIVVCIFAGLIYRSQTHARAQREAGELLAAVEKEKPEEQVPLLSAFVEKNPSLQAEALYRLGEAAFAQKDYGKAREAFERVQRDFRKSPFAPDATEGLGNVYESLDPPDYENARKAYEQVMNEWPDSYAASRQYFNLGRCYEREGRLTDAIAAYKSQLTFAPASGAAKKAQDALDRLRLTNPDLFADETKIETVSPLTEQEGVASPPEQVPSSEESPADVSSSETLESPPDLKLTLPSGDVGSANATLPDIGGSSEGNDSPSDQSSP